MQTISREELKSKIDLGEGVMEGGRSAAGALSQAHYSGLAAPRWTIWSASLGGPESWRPVFKSKVE